MNIIYERFDSIHQLLNVIDSRPNNDIMKNDHGSNDPDYSFSKTHNYDEAQELLIGGWAEPLDQIKKETEKINYTGKGYKPVPQNAIVGYIPNVPNALMNLPQSMITINRIPQKVRAISIYYSNCANCKVQAKSFIENGIKILTLVNKLEASGIRVNLYSVLYYAKKENDFAFVPVKIKDFRDKLDLKKICFPLVHPSWFRRIGFKWLETCKGLISRGWAHEYGISIYISDDHESYKKRLIELKILKESDLFFSFYQVEKLNVDELVKSIVK